jgi:excisionase family DNA binding protein
MSDELSIPLPDDLLDAQRVADIVATRMENALKPRNVRWMNTHEVAEYLGMTRGALYGKAAEGSIPHYKVDRRLLFRKDEVDACMEDHREAPHSASRLVGASGRSAHRQARP